MCNKIGYESKSEATEDAKRILTNTKYRNKKVRKATKKQRAYACPFCDKWHLTTQKKHKRRARR